MPPIRDGNLSAEALVSRVYGPQVGKFDGPWGTLFRREKDFGGVETLAARCVIVAAIYPPWIDRRTGDPAMTAWLVERSHPDAHAWWEVLLEDPTISHVSGVVELMAPAEEE